jgi:hypothetical protein
MASIISYTKAKIDALLATKLNAADVNATVAPSDIGAQAALPSAQGHTADVYLGGDLQWHTFTSGGGGGTIGGGTGTNLLTNGNFSNYDVGWTGIYGGRSAASQKLVFTASDAYDPVYQSISLTAGKYYEITYTISGFTSGDFFAQLSGGGTAVPGTHRTANGTFTERLLASTGNTQVQFLCSTTSTLTVDDVIVSGPYTTSTVGGA